MPTISMFYGIIIQMFWDEHAPTLSVMRGKLPRRAKALVLEWASQHREELMEDWKLCEQKKQPRKIKPLY